MKLCSQFIFFTLYSMRTVSSTTFHLRTAHPPHWPCCFGTNKTYYIICVYICIYIHIILYVLYICIYMYTYKKVHTQIPRRHPNVLQLLVVEEIFGQGTFHRFHFKPYIYRIVIQLLFFRWFWELLLLTTLYIYIIYIIYSQMLIFIRLHVVATMEECGEWFFRYRYTAKYQNI